MVGSEKLSLLAETKLCSKFILVGYPHRDDIHLSECQRSGKSEANGCMYCGAVQLLLTVELQEIELL